MSWPERERRAHPRVAASFRLTLAIEVGVGGSATAHGATVNISRGGMMAAVDRRLPLKARCVIRFTEAATRICPTETRGEVIRVYRQEKGFLVGIMFDEPLEVLEVEHTLWRKRRMFSHPDRH